MSIAGPLTLLKMEWLQTIVPQLIDRLGEALDQATPIHEVEQRLWDALLETGTSFALCPCCIRWISGIRAV